MTTALFSLPTDNPCLPLGWEEGLWPDWVCPPVPSLAPRIGLSHQPGAETLTASVREPIFQTLHSLTCNWITLSLAATGTTSAIAVLAMATLITLPPEPECHHLSRMASDRDRVTCWQRAIATQHPYVLVTAIAAVEQWTPAHPLYAEGQELLANWTEQLPRSMTVPGQEVSVTESFSTPSPLPLPSPSMALSDHPHVTATTLYTQAQIALQTQDWSTAFQSLWQLQDWELVSRQSGLAAILAQQIEAERHAQAQVNAAIQAQSIGERYRAIALLQNLDANTYAARTSQPLLTAWQSVSVPEAPPTSAQSQSLEVMDVVPENTYYPGFATRGLREVSRRSHWPQIAP